MDFEPLLEKEEFIAGKIVGAAYVAHKALGPGLLEKVYEAFFVTNFPKRKRLGFLINFDVPLIKEDIKRIVF